MKCAIITLCVLIASLEQVMSDDVDRPVVETSSGRYRGHVLKTRGGRDVLAFQGIPYALPPIGQLRFKDPVKMPKLEGIFDANDESRECYQPVFDFTKLNNMSEFHGTEDCLYLNVYTPKMITNNSKLPVLFWIHGGGYYMASGSTTYNGPEYLLDKDIILVTINYRLGVLGFLSTGDSRLPGNFGMKDQVVALRWVVENIAAFGGNPKSITLAGESAGGASVVQHMHSKLSQGLFDKAIAQSGSMDCLWATKTGEDAGDFAERFTSQVHCPLQQDDFMECLQNKPIENLFQAANNIKDPMGVLSMDFVPVIESESPSAFLTESSIRSESNVSLIIGVTSHESLNMPAFLSAINPKYGEMSGISEDHERLFPIINYYYTNPDASDMTRRLVQFYFGEQGITKSSQESLINLVGDMMFTYPVNVRARRHKGSTYLYMFSYKGQFDHPPFTPKGFENGVAHAEDLLYLFDFKFIPNVKLGAEDEPMSHRVVQMWYDFIRTGNPTPDSKLWEDSEGGVKYLDFTNEGLHMESNMFQARMKFLDSLNIEVRSKPTT